MQDIRELGTIPMGQVELYESLSLKEAKLSFRPFLVPFIPLGTLAATTSSVMVFHSPHASHFPDQRELTAPQALQ